MLCKSSSDDSVIAKMSPQNIGNNRKVLNRIHSHKITNAANNNNNNNNNINSMTVLNDSCCSAIHFSEVESPPHSPNFSWVTNDIHYSTPPPNILRRFSSNDISDTFRVCFY